MLPALADGGVALGPRRGHGKLRAVRQQPVLGLNLPRRAFLIANILLLRAKGYISVGFAPVQGAVDVGAVGHERAQAARVVVGVGPKQKGDALLAGQVGVQTRMLGKEGVDAGYVIGADGLGQRQGRGGRKVLLRRVFVDGVGQRQHMK